MSIPNGTSNVTYNVDYTNNEFRPSPGDDHGVSSPHGISTHNVGDTENESRPSPGDAHSESSPHGTSNITYNIDDTNNEGHGFSSSLRTCNEFDKMEDNYIAKSGQSPKEGHGVSSPRGTSNALHNEENINLGQVLVHQGLLETSNKD